MPRPLTWTGGLPLEDEMKALLKSSVAGRPAWAMLLAVLCAVSFCPAARADNPHLLTVMTRNMDAGTDLNYILAATDLGSLMAGTAATLAEVKASDFRGRASRLADEIAAKQPDLIGLQEVTLWRTGTVMQPPATHVLYDQLDLLMTELAGRKLHYAVVAVQPLLDAEAPVPSEGVDLRLTDRNVILARTDLPRSQFDISNVETHRYQIFFQFGSDLLGEFVEPAGWMSVDVEVMKSKVRFVNTHLETSTVPFGDQIQRAQAAELLAAVRSAGMPVILAGDFNANAELGPEHTGTVEMIVDTGFTDTWKAMHPYDPGYTWPLFGEDQLSGPAVPNERIDLIFVSGDMAGALGVHAGTSVELTGTERPWASDHAGLVLRMRIK
jgi:endonuclease/exonuclease/phosphatase family metal-dependent hydrolase